jgi:hypothetical protein
MRFSCYADEFDYYSQKNYQILQVDYQIRLLNHSRLLNFEFILNFNNLPNITFTNKYTQINEK